MRCPECGQENPAEAAQCASCGYPLGAPAQRERPVGSAAAARPLVWWKRLLLWLVVAAALVYVLHSFWYLAYRSREIRRSQQCSHNIKTLGLALSMYLDENDQRMPLSDSWCDALLPYVDDRDAFVCPNAQNQRCSYAFSRWMSGVDTRTLRDPVKVIAVFESDAGWNASGGSELLSALPRHGWHRKSRHDWYMYADGHAWVLHRWKLPDGSWEKEPHEDWAMWEPVLHQDWESP